MKAVPRLLEQFLPKHYDLSLALDKEALSFSGRVVIDGELPAAANQIRLHAKGLTVTKAALKGKPLTWRLIPSRDELVLETGQLPPRPVKLELEFEGRITDPMHGIYPCSFQLGDVKKKLIATQFESHHAREVFPCVDEPAAKATFGLTLRTPAGETVLANTPPKSTRKTGKHLVTAFEKTPLMSPYLLAFAVGELDRKQTKTKSGTLVRGWTTPGKVGQVGFALDVARKALDYFEDYFQIPFPLPKCDFVALPDFAAGAMENWGLITFRETALLVDESNSSLETKQFVAMVVAHEIAHQWFGNLVTMEWYTDLWLNEGFASWIEYMAIDHLFPEWRMWEQFLAGEFNRAMALDSLGNTHPIEVPVYDPAEIRTIFDDISYNKGASVIRMLHAYLGGEDFRHGLGSYLRRHMYGNAKTADLWQALEQVSGKPVRDFMSAWTTRPGFPVLRVKRSGDKLGLSQNRYYINPMERRHSRQAWPIAIELDGKVELIRSRQTKVPAPANIARLNPDRTGFYMLDYGEQVAELAQQLPQLETAERLGLLQDAFQLAKADFTPTVSALGLLERYASEDNLVVWETISGQVSALVRVLNDREVRRGMRVLTGELIGRQLERLGWEPKTHEDHFDRLLRPVILGLASFARLPDVMAGGWERFSAAKRPADIHPDIRSVVYGIAVKKTESSATFNKLLAWHNSAESAEDRDRLAGALSGFKKPEHYRRAIDLIDSPQVRLQDVGSWIGGSLGNRHSKAAAWQWLKHKWPWIEQKFGNDMIISRLPLIAGRAFSDKAMLESYDQFFGSIKTRGLERSIAQGHETLQWQMLWRDRDLSAVRDWLRR